MKKTEVIMEHISGFLSFAGVEFGPLCWFSVTAAVRMLWVEEMLLLFLFFLSRTGCQRKARGRGGRRHLAPYHTKAVLHLEVKAGRCDVKLCLEVCVTLNKECLMDSGAWQPVDIHNCLLNNTVTQTKQ